MECDKETLDKGIQGMKTLVETYKANPRQGDPKPVLEVCQLAKINRQNIYSHSQSILDSKREIMLLDLTQSHYQTQIEEMRDVIKGKIIFRIQPS